LVVVRFTPILRRSFNIAIIPPLVVQLFSDCARVWSFPLTGCVAATDEVGALVMDCGSATCKVGFAGKDAPQSVFPTVRNDALFVFHTSVILLI
jgi:hypothetical protein